MEHYIAMQLLVKMCMVGALLAGDLCEDKSPPMVMQMSILHGLGDGNCVPPDKLISACVKEWKSIFEIERDGKLLFIMHPDGSTEKFNGFEPDLAAQAFWKALAANIPAGWFKP